MDRIADAESLVRVKVLRPALEEIITEKALQEDPLGFKGMLQAAFKVRKLSDALKSGVFVILARNA